MKKTFILLFLIYFHVLAAQEEIQGAFGVDFGSSMESVKEHFSYKDIPVEKREHGYNLTITDISLGGFTWDLLMLKFTNDDELFNIMGLIKIDVKTYIEGEEQIMIIYNELKNILKKYGNPVHKENPDYPYKKGDWEFGVALRDGKAIYSDYWLGAPDWKDMITLSWLIIAGYPTIKLEYSNNKLEAKALQDLYNNRKSVF